MAETYIVCPNCRKKIPLTEAISHQIEERIAQKYEAKTRTAAEALNEREKALSEKEQSLEKSRKALDDLVAKKIVSEREKLEKLARNKAREEVSIEIKDLTAQVEEKTRRIEFVEKAELEIRRERRKLEEAKRSFALDLERKMDCQRKEIEEKTATRVTEEHRLKDAEKEKLISDMRRQIEDLKRKSEQGSVQAQGEVLEIELEAILKKNFPGDQIDPVPTGMRGADIIHRVRNDRGEEAGTIVWESKRTKAWSDGWVAKLKDDQRKVNAEMAVLVSEVLPKGVQAIGQVEGVWVTGYITVAGLATALRSVLIEVSGAKLAAVGKADKMEMIYGFLSGPQFRQKVEGIVEAFTALKADLESEKRAMTRIWSKREKQIERVVTNTVSIYGAVAGIIGASLPRIESLELKAIAAGEADPGGSEEEPAE